MEWGEKGVQPEACLCRQAKRRVAELEKDEILMEVRKMAWEKIREIKGNILEQPISLFELEGWNCLICGRVLWYQGQVRGSRIIHSFVCKDCNREYEVIIERLLNPGGEIIIISKPGEKISPLIASLEKENYERFVQRVEQGNISELEIRLDLETGALNPFNLPVALCQILKDQEILRLRIKAQNIIDGRYEKLIDEFFQELKTKTLVLCNGWIVFASKLIYGPEDKELEGIENEEGKLCFVYHREESIGIG